MKYLNHLRPNTYDIFSFYSSPPVYIEAQIEKVMQPVADLIIVLKSSPLCTHSHSMASQWVEYTSVLLDFEFGQVTLLWPIEFFSSFVNMYI